jgi:hypothetical protein
MTTATAIQEPPKKAKPSEEEIINIRFSPEAGWKNSRVATGYWRVNRWERTSSGCGNIAESYFVTVTPDGLVTQ